LQDFWRIALRTFGVIDAHTPITSTSKSNSTNSDASPTESGNKTKAFEKPKERTGIFGWRKSSKESNRPGSETCSMDSAIGMTPIDSAEDKYGQTKEFKKALVDLSPEDIRRAFWTMAKHEDPDALLLRFLRARKWDISAALVMMIATIRWRLVDVHLDDDIMLHGDLVDDQDFMNEIRMGKAFLHGIDGENRPTCFVRARLQRIGQSSAASLERLIVYTIETSRLLLQDADTGVSTLLNKRIYQLLIDTDHCI
jgi:hypothetical protein